MAPARMFGWVVVLMTGQRLYIETEVTGVESQRTELEITLPAVQQQYPDELEAAPCLPGCKPRTALLKRRQLLAR